MQNHERVKHIMQAKSTNARIAHQASRTMMRRSEPSHHQNGNVHGWYQRMKRTSQRLKALSPHLVLVEKTSRNDFARLRIQDLRCSHVFLASLKEIFLIGEQSICPFCTMPEDLRRCGSIAAVQEFVLHRSDNKISFAHDNHLGACGDLYTYGCQIHRFLFDATFTSFIEDMEKGTEFCPACAFG